MSYCAPLRDVPRSARISFLGTGSVPTTTQPYQTSPREGIASEKDICVFSLVCCTAGNGHSDAQSICKHNYEFSSDGRQVRVQNPSTAVSTAPEAGSKFTLIAGNISAYPQAAYFSIFGNTIAQGGANFPFQTWVANPFTPTANASVAAIQVAVGRLGSGTSGFEVGLYNDASGVPGTLIL